MSTFIEDFECNFNKYKKLPVVLYGIGEKTKTILEETRGFNFVGLMDKDTTGQIIYGKKVISTEEAIEKAKLIIIVANMSVVNIIYNRIKFLQKQHNLRILYINGEEPQEIEIKDEEYFNSSYFQLKSQIENHDVISFDLFDTLIMRKVLEPKDIFFIVQEKIKAERELEVPFFEARIKAANFCRHYIDENCTINQIYEKLADILELDEEFKKYILNLEVQTELDFIMPRKVIVESFNYARKLGKKICITSDMYLTKEIINKILERNSIEGYDYLLISCEEGKSKCAGDLYDRIIQLFPQEKVLHIGDSRYIDIKMAQKAGMNTFFICSSYNLWEISSIKYLVKYANEMENRLLLGLIVSEIFNDPFAINQTKGIVKLGDMNVIGQIIFAPIAIRFIYDLIYMSKNKGINVLLFFARDGYILKQIYEKIVSYYKISAPKPLYFYTSRRAASLASIKDVEDIEFIIKNLCKSKKEIIKDILMAAFEIDLNPDDEMAQKYYYEITEDNLIKYVIKNYGAQILDKAQRERKNYLSYIRQIKLNNEDKIGCVNFVGRGMTQYFVSKIINKNMVGYYFATELDIQEVFLDLSNIHGIYGTLVSPYTSNCLVANKYLFGEVIFSAPEGQLIRFDDKGNQIFQKRNLKYDNIEASHVGILYFLDEILGKNPLFRYFKWDKNLVQELYGLVSSSEKVIIPTEIKNRFQLDDYYNYLNINLYNE